MIDEKDYPKVYEKSFVVYSYDKDFGSAFNLNQRVFQIIKIWITKL